MAKAKRNPETGKMEPTGEYPVGFSRPPVDSRFRPGQSGNPNGRPKGRRNMKTEIKQIVEKKITIRDGETERQVSLFGANVLAHGVKGAKGDARSSTVFFNQVHKLRLVEPDQPDIDQYGSGNALVARASPGGKLFDNLDLKLLSREEQIELSRLAEIIDLGGDFTALNADDFERLKYLINKGRGKDVTPQ